MREIGAWVVSLCAPLLGFLLTWLVAPSVDVSSLTAFAVGFACVSAAALGAGRLAPPRWLGSPRWALGIVALAVAMLAFIDAGRSVGVVSVLFVFLALLAAGSSLGAWVGSRIQHPGHLLFVAVASGLADVFSVTQPEGPSAAIVQSERALQLVALSWPMLGSRLVEPLLGVGDVVFTALYLSAARRHGLPLRRTVVSLAVAFLVTMLTVIMCRAPVPALPMLGAAMLIAHPSVLSVPAHDWRRGIFALSVMAAVFAALFLRR